MSGARGRAAGMRAAVACALTACAPERSGSELPTAADMLGLLKRGGGPNVAVTAPDADDPRLRPHTYAGKASEVARLTEEAITPLPRWEVVAGRSGVIWLTRRTRLGFVDDIYLLLLPTGDSTVVFARSASRVGRFDLGQNRRNLGELWAALEKEMRAGEGGRGRARGLGARPTVWASPRRCRVRPVGGTPNRSEQLTRRSEAPAVGPRAPFPALSRPFPPSSPRCCV